MLGDWNNTLKHDFNYKMLGAERHEDFGLNLDLHAFRGRFNDLPNWTSVDALSEDFSHQSPYVVNDNNPIIRVDELGLAAESTQQLLESVWEQGNGSYDNDGNRIEEESGEEEGDCCGEGYGRYIAAKAEAERTEQDISETYKEINRQHYEGSKRSLKEAAIWYFGGIAFKLVFRGGRALWVATRGVDAAKGGKWVYGGFKSSTKWANQLSKRGWTEKQIGEAIAKGKQFNAVNNVNKANAATRYVHPTTGQSVVIDNVTKELLHVGGKGFKY